MQTGGPLPGTGTRTAPRLALWMCGICVSRVPDFRAAVLGSRNMPQASFLREGKYILPPQQLRALFGEAHVDPLKPMIALYVGLELLL